MKKEILKIAFDGTRFFSFPGQFQVRSYGLWVVCRFHCNARQATLESKEPDCTDESRMIPDNQITLLQNGEDYFLALEVAMDRAKHEIYLETYIFENDNTGQRIAQALRRAALRGVKSHMLIDGFGSIGLPKNMIDELEEVGVRVLKFRPKTSPWTLRRRRLRRLHRKIVVIDQTIAL